MGRSVPDHLCPVLPLCPIRSQLLRTKEFTVKKHRVEGPVVSRLDEIRGTALLGYEMHGNGRSTQKTVSSSRAFRAETLSFSGMLTANLL